MTPAQETYEAHLIKVEATVTRLAGTVEKLRQSINELDSAFHTVEDAQCDELHSLDRDDVITELRTLGRSRRNLGRIAAGFAQELARLRADNATTADEPEDAGTTPMYSDGANLVCLPRHLQASIGGRSMIAQPANVAIIPAGTTHIDVDALLATQHTAGDPPVADAEGGL